MEPEPGQQCRFSAKGGRRLQQPARDEIRFARDGGRAVLATKAWIEIPNVVVEVPANLAPIAGGTHVAQPAGSSKLKVNAGKQPRFYLLEAR